MSSLQKSLTLTIMFVTLNSANAALAPHHNNEAKLSEMKYAYISRDAAPDIIKIRVSEIEGIPDQGDGCSQIDSYTVKATVDAVEKGKLKINDNITIKYQRMYYLCPGPQTRSPKILVKGKTYSAYLKCNNNVCRLNGDAWSFHGKKEFEEEFDEAEFKSKLWDEK